MPGDRYAKDIRRIAGVDEEQHGIGNAKERGAIGSRRAVAFNQNSTGGGTMGSVSADDDTTNPFNFLTNHGDTTSADAVMGTSSTFATLKKGDTLKEMDATDCATGDPLSIRTDGEFTAPPEIRADNGVLQHNEWVDANTPPVKAHFVLGKYYEVSADPGDGNPSLPQAATPIDAAALFVSRTNTVAVGDKPYTFVDISAVSSSAWSFRVTTSTMATLEFNGSVLDCVAVPPDAPATSCPAEAPLEEFWPNLPGTKEQLTFKNGNIETNPFDQNAKNKHKHSRKLNFCYDNGDKTGTMEAAVEGGFMLYETVSDGGDVVLNTPVRIFDSRGVLTDIVDEDFIDEYRPN